MGRFSFFDIFMFWKRTKKISLGLYGPPNAGKSTLANKILNDILGEDAPQFSTSSVEHETREVQKVEKLELDYKGKKINFNLIDTPGIATKIDFEDFVKKGVKKKDAKERAKEATQGVIESIKWLDNVDAVLVVLDATLNPYSQVNITLVANLVAKKKKLIIVANKMDMKKANIEKIRLVFPDYSLVPISAKTGEGVTELYDVIYKEFLLRMGVQVLSYELVGEMRPSEKLERILSIVKKGDIVMVEGRLSPEEETTLISRALKNVSGKFPGIEIAFLQSTGSKSVLKKVKESILKIIAGNRIGLTVIGPSKIIKEIKMDPNKLEILFK